MLEDLKTECKKVNGFQDEFSQRDLEADVVGGTHDELTRCVRVANWMQ